MEYDVCIIMPCLNEILSLEHCINNAKEALNQINQEHGLNGYILISDNGSNDGSQELALSLGCTVENAEIRGYGAAIINGAKKANAKYLLIGDADGSYNFIDGVPMIAKLVEGFDICLGNRFKGEILPGAMPWKNKYIGNPILSGILKIMYKTSIGDSHCGLRAISKEAFEKLQLKTPGMEFASEMVVKSSLKCLKEAEVPINLHKDLRDRPPHLKPVRDGLRHLRFLFMLNPFWCFFLPAILILLPNLLIFGNLLGTEHNKMAYILGLPFGDHWTILSSSLIGVSISSILLGFLSIKHNANIGLYQRQPFYLNLNEQIKSNHLLIFGLISLLIGAAIILILTNFYFFGDLHTITRHREMILGTLLFGIGLKSIFWYFIFSLYE